MALLTYRGTNKELQGMQFDVPATIPMSQAAAWIESQEREREAREKANLAKAEADAEAQRRERELLAARIEEAKTGEAFRTDLNNLQAQIAEVREQLQEPDSEALLSMSNTVMNAFSTAREVLGKVDEAIAKAERLQGDAADLLSEAEAVRGASVQLVRNQKEAINGSFETFGFALEDLQEQVNQASAAVGELNTAAQDNRETIATAANISEEAVNIAGLEAKKAVDQGMEEMLAVLSVALEAMGINEQSLAIQLNTDEIDPNRGVFLTREYIRRILAIHSGKGNARDADIEGPLL